MDSAPPAAVAAATDLVNRLRLVVAVLVLSAVAPARADMNTLTLRGNYYRDRNTRVVQPALEIKKELPSGTQLEAHYLLDAITSASVAAGVLRDQPFTELRNETGFSLGQRFGPALVLGSYSYSSESDYWAHTASLGVVLELFRKNTLLGASVSYGNDKIALRMGPTLYNPIGGLQTVRGIVTLTQELTRTLRLAASYELAIVGFGTPDNGWQGNVYRTVNLGGAPARELVPYQRIRQAAAAQLHWAVPLPIRLVPYFVFRPSYRLYWDDWGLLSHTPELRMYVPVGPVEFRVTGRLYFQNHVSFWSDDGVRPSYPQGVQGLHCTTCALASSRTGLWYTADPKLGNGQTEFLELRVIVNLRAMRSWRWMPAAAWLSEGIVELSYGHYFNSSFAHTAFGDADIAGLTLEWPL
ncbi:MAG: hypothetical protein JWN44_86 [Myxococcales bacterium]|nr:hypothetical protein [Myxococcales bacterium]